MGEMYHILDSGLAEQAKEILEQIGINTDIAVHMMLKRIVRERSITFLLPELTESGKREIPASETQREGNMTDHEKGKITKNRAINQFKREGIVCSDNVTFASKNRGANNYWANPDACVLERDWYLILNDWIRCELHLFAIPKNAISAQDVVYRSDKQEKIDLQIMYDDCTFTDNRSKISFAKYWIKTIRY